MPRKAKAIRTEAECDTYRIFFGMRGRCNNPSDKAYHNYGGRGIKVCARWESFDNFLEDMGPRPSKKHSIDRIDNDGNYEPENCRWATSKEQSRNRRKTIYITIADVTMPGIEWCERFGISYVAFFERYRSGWPDHECVYGKPSANVFTYKGKTQTVQEWAIEYGVKERTMTTRWRDWKWTPEECLFGKPHSGTRRTPAIITYKGKTQSMNAWCDELGLSQATVYCRYRKSKDPEYLFSIPRPQKG